MAGIRVKPTLGCYDLPEVEYRIVRSGRGVRIAWWNRRGGIDYYTFRSDLDKSYTTERTKIKTAEGWRTVSSEVEDERNISSGGLPGFMLEWLGEIVSAPKVWLIDGDQAIPIDITSDVITTFDQAEMPQLELTFRSIDTEKNANDMIDLYIDGKRLDTDQQTDAAITLSIGSVEDPSQSLTAFSKSIEVPATARNKEIMQFADQLHGVEQFNNAKHPARLEAGAWW